MSKLCKDCACEWVCGITHTPENEACENYKAEAITELEKIKEKVKQRKILPKKSARNNYEMGLIDGRSTEKVAIIYIIEKEIAELKGENNG